MAIHPPSIHPPSIHPPSIHRYVVAGIPEESSLQGVVIAEGRQCKGTSLQRDVIKGVASVEI
jgi:hypothetical protein